MTISLLQSNKTFVKLVLVLNALLFSALAVCDHFEDVEDVLYQDIEILTEQDFDDFDFPAKISRALEYPLVLFERTEQIKVVDFLLSVIVPLEVYQDDFFIQPPKIQIVYQFFVGTSIFRNAP
ncbi:hypothetical protein [Mongoliitalea daihaiensis]|uniref:hypothetical protein n=1 Tax=Mongoliitalea daihaiensis TaxID=2782006 RepID=UPI001F4668F6|nr:hypothetical protein [Mongoliitalea daihaiensis]UJP63734.1 hypothetical protein IPZ59_12940 [Mongoliitalea daihaiensis]